MNRRILAVGALGGVESMLRIFFYYEAVFAGVQLLQLMPPPSTMNTVDSINLLLGLAGMVFVAGLLLSTGWGFWGMIGVSVATIVFDGASSAAVSFTAFAGLVLPVLFLIALVPWRTAYFSSAGGERR